MNTFQNLTAIQALGTEYYSKMKETVFSKTKPDAHPYVGRCGISAITRVFILIAGSYSDECLAFKTARKGLYYYLEFIGQISLDDHIFLNLTPQDALQFVYRKTLDGLENSASGHVDSDLTRVLELILHVLDKTSSIDVQGECYQVVLEHLKPHSHNRCELRDTLQLCEDKLDTIEIIESKGALLNLLGGH